MLASEYPSFDLTIIDQSTSDATRREVEAIAESDPRPRYADRVVLLRPEISIRHDAKRESEDWPSLLLAYGTGNGGFYTKHIRCRDPRALWLFSKQFGKFAAKLLVKGVRGRKLMERFYVRGVLIGARNSFKFRIDRSAAQQQGGERETDLLAVGEDDLVADPSAEAAPRQHHVVVGGRPSAAAAHPPSRWAEEWSTRSAPNPSAISM